LFYRVNHFYWPLKSAAFAISMSVRLFVCLSVTLMIRAKTVQDVEIYFTSYRTIEGYF